MEGYGFLIFLVLAVAVLLLVAGWILKKALPLEKVNQIMAVSFAALLLASIALIIISLYIGGWAGMGYGVIGMCVLIGTIIGGFLYAGFYYFSDRRRAEK